MVAAMTDAIVKSVPTQPPQVLDLLNKAVEQGMDPSALEKLVALYERMADRAAAEAFNQALAAFQADMPAVTKNSVSNQVSAHGMGKPIRYAQLSTIMAVARPLLLKHGLSVTWDSVEESGRKRTSCIVRHIAGHERQASFECPIESKAGMSAQQKAASANSYGMRYALIMALGLTTVDPDTDGVDAEDMEPVTQEQLDMIERALADTGADRPRFMEYLGLSDMHDMTVGHYRKAAAALMQKKKRMQREGGGHGPAAD
jgi:hypothetical protein